MVAWEYCCQEVKSGGAAEIEPALLMPGEKGWEAVCMISNGSYFYLNVLRHLRLTHQ